MPKPSCVVCLEEFTPGAAEHILPNGLGWREKTRDIVCPKCNAATSPLDSQLTHAFEGLTTLINPRGRRKTAPGFEARRVRVSAPASSEPFSIEAAEPLLLRAGPIPVMPRLIHARRPDGKEVVLWKTPEDLERWEAKAKGRGRVRSVTNKGMASLDFTFDLRVFDQTSAVWPSVAKAALHEAARLVPSWDRTGSGADAARELVSGKPTSRLWVMSWDHDLPAMSEEPFYHGMEVTACPDSRLLMVRVHVYGLLRCRIVLSDSYSGKEHFKRRTLEFPLSGESVCQALDCRHEIPWLVGFAHLGMDEIEARLKDYFAQHRGRLALGPMYDRWPAEVGENPS